MIWKGWNVVISNKESCKPSAARQQLCMDSRTQPKTQNQLSSRGGAGIVDSAHQEYVSAHWCHKSRLAVEFEVREEYRDRKGHEEVGRAGQSWKPRGNGPTCAPHGSLFFFFFFFVGGDVDRESVNLAVTLCWILSRGRMGVGKWRRCWHEKEVRTFPSQSVNERKQLLGPPNLWEKKPQLKIIFQSSAGRVLRSARLE